MLTDLAALTPSVVVAAAFVLLLLSLLRREMAPRKRKPRDTDSGEH